MNDTVSTIVQIAQLPMSALILVGLYLLVVKLLPVVLANSNKHTEAMTQMAQAIMKVVETGVGLRTATESMLETAKGFQVSVNANVQMGEMIKTLIEQNSRQIEANSDDHTKLMILIRSQYKAISSLPCQSLGQRACPDSEES